MPLIGYRQGAVGYHPECGIAAHPTGNREWIINDVQIGLNGECYRVAVCAPCGIGSRHVEHRSVITGINRCDGIVIVGCVRYRTASDSRPCIGYGRGADGL
jgi:hypothetical protein